MVVNPYGDAPGGMHSPYQKERRGTTVGGRRAAPQHHLQLAIRRGFAPLCPRSAEIGMILSGELMSL